MTDNHIVSGDTNGNIVVFDILKDNFDMKMKVDGAVTSIAFSTDRKQIVSSTFDDQATLWDVETGAIVRTFNAHDKGSIITSLSVSDFVPKDNSDECALPDVYGIEDKDLNPKKVEEIQNEEKKRNALINAVFDSKEFDELSERKCDSKEMKQKAMIELAKMINDK